MRFPVTRGGRRRQAGLTLIEMMIAVLISMVLSIAVMMVMSTFEGRRRTLGSTSDMDQTSALAMFQLDRWIRSAGSGLVQGNSSTYGCKILASLAGTQILPATTALPAPFASVSPQVSGEFRIAPVMILPGQTTPGVSGQASDVLVVMSAGNDASQVPLPVRGSPTTSSISVDNITEFSPSDLLLVVDQQTASGGGPKDCMVSQAASTLSTGGTGTALALGGATPNYFASTINSIAITSFTDQTTVYDLGGAAAGGASQPPTLQVIGVGDNNTLFSYDLLKIAGTTPQPQAEGVFEMHAIYGVDSTGNSNNIIDNWVSAGTTSAYSVNALSDGSATATTLLKRIRAVRVALIMRTSLPEKDAVPASTTLTMFSDLSSYGVSLTRTLSAAEQHYRYRVVESTIPVRNNNF
jgi:type IV pilus assembly protein PilW